MGCIGSQTIKTGESHGGIQDTTAEPSNTPVSKVKMRKNTSVFSGKSFDQPEQIFEWKLIDEISHGSKSRVFKTKNTETNEICAAKIYDRSMLRRMAIESMEPPFAAVQREIDIMVAAEHRYVLPAKEVIDDEVMNAIVIVMPYSEKGTLKNMISDGTFKDEFMCICFYDVALALYYLHSLNIVHRDIKPENILVFSDVEYVISDFSISSKLADEKELLEDTRGTPAFLSPEECTEDPFAPKPADVWAYGVTMYYAAFRSFPFKLESVCCQNSATTAIAISNLITHEKLAFPEGTDMTSDTVRIISSILVKDPSKRPAFATLIDDPYFSKVKKIDNLNLVKWNNRLVTGRS